MCPFLRQMDAIYKRQVVAVDSRSRLNPDLTTPARYKVNFPIINNVKMVRLVSTEVPNTEYVFHSRNNLLYMFDPVGDPMAVPPLPAGEHVVTISPGTYNATELANEVNFKLNQAVNAPFGAVFQVTAMTMTSKLRIDKVDGNDWALRFAGKRNTAALQMGFDPDVDAIMVRPDPLANMYTQSNTVYNLSGENSIFMCIKGMPTVLSTERIGDVFAKIIFNVPPRSIAFDSFVNNAFVFPEPAHLSQLEVSFVRQDGFAVDFNDVEHSFTLEFFNL